MYKFDLNQIKFDCNQIICLKIFVDGISLI